LSVLVLVNVKTGEDGKGGGGEGGEGGGDEGGDGGESQFRVLGMPVSDPENVAD